MKHDTRTMIRSETGVVHYWRSHRPGQTFCGIHVGIKWRVIDKSMAGCEGAFCLRCQDKDDTEGFEYYNGDKLPEPDIIVRYCQCGHQQARHALGFGKERGKCLNCECQQFEKGPTESYLLGES